MIELFTDGSYDQKLHIGGWAYVAYHDGTEIFHQVGSAAGASSNHFELLAVLNAATFAASLNLSCHILIWTDSFRVMEGVRRLLPIWRNNDWRKIDPNLRHRRRALPDRDLWQSLDRILSKHPHIVVDWCKAHQGLDGNERADRLASKGRLAQAK